MSGLNDMGMYGMGLALGAFNDDEYPDFAVVTGSISFFQTGLGIGMMLHSKVL